MNRINSSRGIFLIGVMALLVTAGAMIQPACWTPKVEAQTPVKFTQQIFPYTFTWTPDGTRKTFAVPNLGQVAHTIAYAFGSVPAQCTLFFEGSNDATKYSILASVPATANLSFNTTLSTSLAQGQYQFFRLDFNSTINAACTAASPVTLNYVGYQFPITSQSPPQQGITTISTPTQLGFFDAAPLVVNGIQCNNTNTSAAYIELFDSPESGTAPVLGTALPSYVMGIDASKSADLPTHNLSMGTGAWAAAVTAPYGSTAVTTPIVCNFQLNVRGPFF